MRDVAMKRNPGLVAEAFQLCCRIIDEAPDEYQSV